MGRLCLFNNVLLCYFFLIYIYAILYLCHLFIYAIYLSILFIYLLISSIYVILEHSLIIGKMFFQLFAAIPFHTAAEFAVSLQKLSAPVG